MRTIAERPMAKVTTGKHCYGNKPKEIANREIKITR